MPNEDEQGRNDFQLLWAPCPPTRCLTATFQIQTEEGLAFNDCEMGFVVASGLCRGLILVHSHWVMTKTTVKLQHS